MPLDMQEACSRIKDLKTANENLNAYYGEIISTYIGSNVITQTNPEQLAFENPSSGLPTTTEMPSEQYDLSPSCEYSETELKRKLSSIQSKLDTMSDDRTTLEETIRMYLVGLC